VTKRRRGRRSKLTPELIAEAAGLIAGGNYASAACAALGIGTSTFYAWLADADAPDADQLKVEFRDAIETAAAEAEIRYVGILDAAARDDARWASWWLERRCGERWRSTDRHELAVEVEGGVMRVPGVMDVDEWQRVAIDQQGRFALAAGE